MHNLSTKLFFSLILIFSAQGTYAASAAQEGLLAGTSVKTLDEYRDHEDVVKIDTMLKKGYKMTWKEQLRTLEKAKKWDKAIEFMKGVIQKNPDDMDAYIFMNYLLMNLLGGEDYDKSKETTYETLIKWYFDESYAKFSHNAEYLYLTGKMAVMGEWFFGIKVEDYDSMIKKAHQLDPQNPLYNQYHYFELEEKDPCNPELVTFANLVLDKNSPITKQFENRGAVGEYILAVARGWGEVILSRAASIKKSAAKEKKP
jgi:hypothetical protein